MALERGGRGDKGGNQYEDRFFAKLLLELLLERLISIEVEPLGHEGIGVEFIATSPDGERRYYQCKGSNGMQSFWHPYDLDRYSVFERAKEHILSGTNHVYYFISPVPYDELDSLCNRARSCNGTEESFTGQVTNASLRKWRRHCENKFQETGTQLVYLLSHCYFELEPIGDEHCRWLESIISILFVEDSTYSASAIRILLERFANDQSYWGKPICESDIVAWLEKQGVHRRIMGQDRSCLYRIHELNRTFVERFQSIGSTLIHRMETDKVLEQIRGGKSVILQGSAGAGKSGCIQEVIQALENSQIPYLALSLDKDQPERSPDQYGRLLELPDSPVATLYRVAGRQRCVLIFDQLDALRWTNSRTSTMLDVCKVMIRQIQEFNRLEHGQISCIFVVRTFDYETDPGLRNLLNPSRGDNPKELLWEKVTVGPLTEANVQSVTGESYRNLSSRLRTLLKTPSNLYIWTQIKSEVRNSVTTLIQLMDVWWQQTLSDCESKGFDRNIITQCYNQLIASMRSRESLFIPLLQVTDRKALDALVSCGILKTTEGKVLFCHQSLLDYSLAVGNLGRLNNGERISAILGNIDRQTPDVRYQLLMLLQYLSEVDHKMFLATCQDLLKAPDIRYYFRCCAFEVLGQSSDPGKNDWELLSNYFQKPDWHSQLIRAVFWGHPAFIHLLLERAPDYPWHEGEGRRLLYSIVQEDPELVWEILQKPMMSATRPHELYEIVSSCTVQSSKVFSLRIQLLLDNVDLLQDDFALYDLIAHGYAQAIPVIKVWVLAGANCRKNVYFFDETVLKPYIKLHYKQIIAELLPVVLEVATAESNAPNASEWFSSNSVVSAERQIVQFLQFTLDQAAEEMPEQFFQYISLCEQSDSPIKQELFLHAMEHLPFNYADEIFGWVLADFDKRAFEETSFEKSRLSCCQRIIQKFSPHCSNAMFTKLEQKIIHWNLPTKIMRDTYEERIACHKIEGGGNYYRAFWGELQWILLPSLDFVRTNTYTKELIKVLNRRFLDPPKRFSISHIEMAQIISSPIDGHLNRINDESWLKLIFDMSMRPSERNGKHWDSGTESTPPMFARSLATAARKEPARFAALLLRFPQNVYDGFVDAVVSVMGSSDVPMPLTCEVLRHSCQSPSTQRAISFSRVLRERSAEDWPSDILQDLIEIAGHHADPEPDPLHTENGKCCCDYLLQDSINCARGCAFTAIAELLWEHPVLAAQFEEILKNAVNDENSAVLFAVMDCAVPLYNIDKSLSKNLFDGLLERDLRTLGARRAWDLLYRFYEDNPEFYTEKLRNAYQSPVNDLKRHAAEMIAALVIKNRWPEEELLKLSLDDNQADAICRQAVICFDDENSHLRCKQLILHIINRSTKLPSLSLLFFNEHIQMRRDKNFLIKLLGKPGRSKVAGDILQYLKEADIDFKECADILFAISNLLSDTQDSFLRYRIDDFIFCVARLFRVGKEDSGILRTCLDIWDAIYRSNPLSVQPLSDLLEQS